MPAALELRFHDVNDLVSPIRDFPGGGGPGSAATVAREPPPGGHGLDARPDVHHLIADLILVVTATEDAHRKIAQHVWHLRRRAPR